MFQFICSFGYSVFDFRLRPRFHIRPRPGLDMPTRIYPGWCTRLSLAAVLCFFFSLDIENGNTRRKATQEDRAGEKGKKERGKRTKTNKRLFFLERWFLLTFVVPLLIYTP
ncbi:uncharacterized protein F4817DRAFT_326031 [Daldinia loculata]|uniref:uncharacterized protein n=1 Tax=Daldinia loculata TaxID=103429 RepID=UPI0020C58225|nr:uncharacterized protein F4817DRAFT_326031 [Daldinia loculata]KAI1650872.1 hypothetical protein F4817DRAFT_326031 [Daldinia loculata]